MLIRCRISPVATTELCEVVHTVMLVVLLPASAWIAWSRYCTPWLIDWPNVRLPSQGVNGNNSLGCHTAPTPPGRLYCCAISAMRSCGGTLARVPERISEAAPLIGPGRGIGGVTGSPKTLSQEGTKSCSRPA